MKAKVMVVDDTEGVRELIGMILQRAGHEPMPKASAAQLLASFTEPQPDVILLDLVLPDGDGLELLPQIKKQWPDTEVIVLTGHASFDVAVEATKRGAYHFQNKPFDQKILLLQVERALEHRRLNQETKALRTALVTMSGGSAPIFQSPGMKSVVRTIERVAPSDVSILITGESGTGKEVIADLIHTMSPRSKGPLIKINCAALPRELIESELFGSVKGAFTGANVDREGLFRQAEGGTLFLDEISEMPIDTQSKLLRVLQEKEVRPVGGRTSYKSDCRIIAATNRPTDEAIKAGKLREDLYYRISAISVYLPPLRERREDILPLANAFLKRFDAQAGRNISGFTPEAAEALRTFDWPGNVRQLQNEIQRAVLMSEGSSVDARDLAITAAMTAKEDSDLTLMEAMERNTILQMLKDTGGNKLETAKRLGIGRQTLYNKIKVYGIEA
ncbi:MAG TPA: sigma-54 dependent transcriptional regulator [Verrucomicrobiae bacterium]|jgi:DNA-binding NtrC family response regulator|nr:sigma-54 dependent transcriptional regulator [Verrucomicrobiae bacterium]